jgi:hypothetical protein
MLHTKNEGGFTTYIMSINTAVNTFLPEKLADN